MGASLLAVVKSIYYYYFQPLLFMDQLQVIDPYNCNIRHLTKTSIIQKRSRA